MKIENVNTEVCRESLSRDEMGEEIINTMMERGLSEAMRGARKAADVFKEIR